MHADPQSLQPTAITASQTTSIDSIHRCEWPRSQMQGKDQKTHTPSVKNAPRCPGSGQCLTSFTAEQMLPAKFQLEFTLCAGI